MTRTPSLADEKDEAEETEAAEPAECDEPGDKERSARFAVALRSGRRVGDSSISVKSLVVGVLVLAAVFAVGVLGWQLHDKAAEIDGLHRQAADSAHAEAVALNYATGAAAMDFHDLTAWRGRLTAGTTPELSHRLTQASNSMEQIITPLQWTSTAKPIAAKVRSVSNGLYTVSCFVDVTTRNQQAPDGIDSTATYQLTIDANHNWVISDISGIDSALGTK